MTSMTQTSQREPQVLVVVRGLQGSGKSTWARKWVSENPSRRVRVNRDDLRMMEYGSYWLGGDPAMERAITDAEHALVRTHLQNRKSVVVDATNLRAATVRAFRKIAEEFNGKVQFRIQDFPVAVETAIERDRARMAAGERGVGEDVIRQTSQRYMRGGSDLPQLDADLYEMILPVEGGTYAEDSSLPSAWLVDIDGTLAQMTGRGAYDWNRVDEDEPVEHVIELVKTLKNAGYTIVVMSGRDGSCEELTRTWLDAWEIPYDELWMRAAGDMRKDNIVKSELFEAHIRGRYYVRGILDDRDQVVKMWREKGLFVAQVAYGNF